ncbi:MAG: hypothetical protein OXB86_01945 [Bdellovibrionales bacterium]|nr:hypothetical protein [Bdellovibrionales bacterium]
MILISALLKEKLANQKTIKTFKNRNLLKQMMAFILVSYLILCQAFSYAEENTPSPKAQGDQSIVQKTSDVSEIPVSELSIPEIQKTKEPEKEW